MPHQKPTKQQLTPPRPSSAGVTGLQTALFLLDAGYDVTIVAKHLPGDLDIDYASPWSVYLHRFPSGD